MQITLHGSEFQSCMAYQQQNKQINNLCRNEECFEKKNFILVPGMQLYKQPKCHALLFVKAYGWIKIYSGQSLSYIFPSSFLSWRIILSTLYIHMETLLNLRNIGHICIIQVLCVVQFLISYQEQESVVGQLMDSFYERCTYHKQIKLKFQTILGSTLCAALERTLAMYLYSYIFVKHILFLKSEILTIF